ncbi:MAG: hypothetical protein RL518_1555 [Pseudomonadota bacterium]|jgi:hypothetical protein
MGQWRIVGLDDPRHFSPVFVPSFVSETARKQPTADFPDTLKVIM